MRTVALLALLSLLAADLQAGTNGILEGVVRDRRTREPLPGVNVVVTGTLQGASSDARGRFTVQNLRAGRYAVRFSLVGYQSALLKEVTVNADLRTRLTVDLDASAVELDEVVVVQQKPLIQRDVTGTTAIVSAEELQALPIDRPAEVLGTRPGVTLEGNVRGGKTTEVAYLVDGLPVRDAIAGGMGTDIPASSITGVSMYTGGFEPEYGNALSGVVNIVTRTGSNDHRFTVRAANDHLFGGTQDSRSTDVELSASGPVLADRMFYLAAVRGYFTDTRWWQDFRPFFGWPVDRSVSGFGKVDYHFDPGLRLGLQLLYADRAWRDYEFPWRFNLDGLPPEHRTSLRGAAVLSHTVSEDFFYTASLSLFSLSARIGDGERADVGPGEPYQYDFYLRYVVDGTRAWWSRTDQLNTTARFDGTWKPGAQHLLKFGAEGTAYDIAAEIVKYEPQKTFFGKPIVTEPQLNFSTAYDYRPFSGSLYVQDKIDLMSDGLLLNLGLRYDVLDPTATRPAIENIPSTDSSFARVNIPEVDASLKDQLSPRLGAAMQIAENGYLFVNLGWYVQFPLFEYLYSGLDRAALGHGVAAVTGNPDLEPERTMSYELSLRYSFPGDITASATYFKKETRNQVDTKTFIPGDSKVSGGLGYAEYVNNPFGEATGLELSVARQRGAWVTGELSYTYMVAEGTSGSAYDGFYIAQYGLPPATRVYPLSWDQRHTVKLNCTVAAPWGTMLTVLAQYHTGRPYTSYPTATGFEPVDGGLFAANNERMPRYANLDFKLFQEFRFDWWPGAVLMVYLDMRNAFGTENVAWMDSNGRIGGELADPSGYHTGRRTSLGLLAEF